MRFWNFRGLVRLLLAGVAPLHCRIGLKPLAAFAHQPLGRDNLQGHSANGAAGDALGENLAGWEKGGGVQLTVFPCV